MKLPKFDIDKIKNTQLGYNAKRHFSDIAMKLFRLIVIIAMGYIFLFPLYYMFVVALQATGGGADPTSIYVPKAISLDAFVRAFGMLNYPKTAGLSLIITIFGTIATLASCSLAGYAFARFKFKGKGIFFFFVILMIVIPPQTTIMSRYLQFRFFDFGGLLSIFGVSVNLLETPWVFILPAIFAAGLKAGLFIFIFRQFFQGQPKELEEAAKIDGCGPFKTFIQIMVPLASAAFITVTVLSVIWHWNDYYDASMFFLDELKPISVMLDNFAYTVSNGGIEVEGELAHPYLQRMYLQAGAALTIIPPLVFYIFIQKKFVESIDRAGIVG